jgi:DNA-binding response OmpR family regulator
MPDAHCTRRNHATLREVEHQFATEQERLAETSLDRRQMSEAIEPALVATLQIDAQGAVYVDGAKLEEDLSPLEYGLLEVLYKRAGRVVNHEELIRVVWAERVYGDWNDDAILTADETSLRKLVSRLRTKLGRGKPGEGTRFVQTVRGRGYTLRLDAPRRDHTP